MVILSEFPQLSFLAWNTNALEIEDDFAYGLYERNWRWIEPSKLTDHEAALIARLQAEFGRGILHV